MDWLMVNPHFHGTFASLGSQVGDTYKVNEDCLATLCDILGKLTIEDRTLRTYRRAMGFAQVVKKDLLPLLIGVRDDPKITDVTIKILLNLTVPVECLLPLDVMLKTDVGRYTVMELSMLLSTSKEGFVPPHCTRPVVDRMKAILEKEPKLTTEDCESISNCLLLLRNVLHIPEHRSSGSIMCMQNQILWNLFAQNVDKVLIQLMTSQYRKYWGVTMVQLIALMYKDQQVGTLQKLLNLWFESSLSDSSEGNESNTSPQHQASGDSSSLMTSDPTSDSSDNGGSNKKRLTYQTGENKSINNESDDSQSSEPGSSTSQQILGNQAGPSESEHQTPQHQTRVTHSSKLRVKSLCELQARPRRFDKHSDGDSGLMDTSDVHSSNGPSHSSSWSRHKHSLVLSQSREAHHVHTGAKSHGKKIDTASEVSDCGYGTQQENQESNSTSSNEDDAPHRCVKHQKPQHMLIKSRYSNGKPPITPQERKELHRKKLVKRSHTNTMHMKALLHHSPSDDDVSNLLKEFTVDFLIRGYGCLVDVLLHHLLDGSPDLMDTSHFFWLVTYFLKFATQLELDLEHISSVLTIDVVAYLTYEGVNLYEELQMGIRNSGRDLKPCLRRMHLVITSIREFLQAVEAYKKISHLTEENRNHLLKLQLQIVDVQDLRGLFVLLLRQYNPSLQSRQFLQDLVVTNHSLLLFIENTSKLPQCHSETSLVEHLKQFGTLKVMHNYGLLLEDFLSNGEFVNDCILTMMHHVAGDLSQIHILFQPSILLCLSRIGQADYEICDDWSDLIEYVIHKYMKNPSGSEESTAVTDKQQVSPLCVESNKTEWPKEDCNNLYWYYQQSCNNADPVGAIVDMYKKGGVCGRTRVGVIRQLLLQDVINDQQYQSCMENEALLVMRKERPSLTGGPSGSWSARAADTNYGKTAAQEDIEQADDIRTLKEKLISEGYKRVIYWLQDVLLELCFVKLCLLHGLTAVKEPIPYIYTRLHQSTPLVPWYDEQEHCLLNPTFILLLHKLGLHLAGDAGKIFPRIPHFWTADVLYETAQKLGSINIKNIKFNISLVKSGATAGESSRQPSNFTTFATQDDGSKREPNSSSGVGCLGNVFLIPTATPRSSLSLSRFTPTPVMPSLPNWLQVVQQSKADASPLKTSLGNLGKLPASPVESIASESRGSSLSMPPKFNEQESKGNVPDSAKLRSDSLELHQHKVESGEKLLSPFSMDGIENEQSYESSDSGVPQNVEHSESSKNIEVPSLDMDASHS